MFDFNEAMRRIDADNARRHSRREMLRVEPCMDSINIGDRILFDAFCSCCGHEGDVKEAYVIEVASVAYKIKRTDYKGAQPFWISQDLIIEVLPPVRAIEEEAG